MSLIDVNKSILGAAQQYKDICWIYPLHINEIIAMGEDTYNEYLSLIATDIREIYSQLRKKNVPEEELNFSALDYLLTHASIDDTFLVKLKEVFRTFIREKVHISIETKEIFIGDDFSQKHSLNNDNFEEFQNIIRAQNKLSIPEPIPINESEMARKFRLRREQVAEAKRKAAMKNGEPVTLADSISTLVCFNVGVTFENVGKLTIFQFKELLARAQAKYKYDLDIRMIAAGADPKKIKPKHWFGKLDY